jgi:arylsulfatase A-like enzyme
VPLIINDGPFSRGTYDGLVQLTDLAPTLLSAAGIDDAMFSEQAQGEAIQPEDSSHRDAAFAEYFHPQPTPESIRERVGDPHGVMKKYDRTLRSIRTDDYKLIRSSDGNIELYETGTGEVNNLINGTGYEAVRERLASKLDEWIGSFNHATADGDVSVNKGTNQILEDLGYL